MRSLGIQQDRLDIHKEKIMKTIKFLDLQKQYLAIKDEVDLAIGDVINRSAFIGGDYVKQFENGFAAYQGARYCVGVGNGTDAMEIAIESLGLPEQSEIIVPANTFVATSEAVTRSGHRVVFCDCNSGNYTISLDDLKKRINAKTGAVVPVHLYGHPCDMDGVMAIAREHGIEVIEDCAQAHGAEYKGKRVGMFGRISSFSFYPGKILGAYGDGGAILTDDEQLAARCRMIANHGRLKKYDHEVEGRNSRLDGLQAAILSVKLKHIDEWIDRRIAVADFFRRHLAKTDAIVLPEEEEWAKAVYHLFVIRTEHRDGLRAFLGDRGVQTGIHYPVALPKLSAYQFLGQEGENFFANRVDSQLLSLPMGEHLEPQELQRVVELVLEFVG